ncbi:UNVERIFIED_ORG: hypothetical protein M2438_001902 [Methylobacterium sp. SuP10 SLI 274]|uniref:hypothetical protein n=1 Tax=Methylorubrum extorquens TaxID=408 RepID=UPI00209DFAB2|nr:hypothetical protein [Methylorubrum extorquens]MCP1557818.1 hypothetical protein [Methylorubrum extorquens]MDF9863115.1 hypothetical protein [Methylorubrum pseudosasae]MDH6636727.1 hypothetical protein [Methylobacterium sp. SuP10 SLI 274]MDH6665904.1 hypothetical protein [Methylorubrum zatmanii]
MCAPVSRDDDLEQTVSAFDLAEVRKDLVRALEAHEALTVRAGIDGETSAQLRAAGIHNPNAVRAALMNAWYAYMATSRNAFERTSGTYASEWDLAAAQDACLDRNNRGTLRTAMRRVDAVEAAERSLIDRAHTIGAELSRLDAAHPYGKSAAPAAHASHEAGFVSPAAA